MYYYDHQSFLFGKVCVGAEETNFVSMLADVIAVIYFLVADTRLQRETRQKLEKQRNVRYEIS